MKLALSSAQGCAPARNPALIASFALAIVFTYSSLPLLLHGQDIKASTTC